MAFILDDATFGVLGGLQEAQTETITGDRGQSVTLDWTQSGNDRDFESYGYSLRFVPAESFAPDANVLNPSSLVRTAYGDGLYSAGPYGGLSGAGQGIFVLDFSTLGTLMISLVESLIQDRGRSIQLDWSASGVDQDLEIFGYGIRFVPAEPHAMEIV